jgi:hypothetical protein
MAAELLFPRHLLIKSLAAIKVHPRLRNGCSNFNGASHPLFLKIFFKNKILDRENRNWN